MIEPSQDRILAAAQRLGQAIAFPTISHANEAECDARPFIDFQDWLLRSYPLCAARLDVRRQGPWNLLLHWPGADTSQEPLILTAHYDVVPPGNPLDWNHGPFSGDLADAQVWGRGALDVKINLIGIMESVERALALGWVPRRDIWLCFGADEEVGGQRGAGELGRYLAAQGVAGARLVDEGGVIARQAIGFIDQPIALIGVGEKGFVNIRITAKGQGGHASMPPRHSAAGILAAALTRIERHPFPSRLTPTLAGFLRRAAPHAPWYLGALLARPRIFWPLIKLALAANPKTAALIRTSQAITMLAGSDKDNVLPASAWALINIRILPGESSPSVVAHYSRLLAKTGCEIEIADAQHLIEPLPQSPMTGPAWDAVVAALGQAEPSALPLPYLVTASTDTRHYLGVADKIFRTMPIVLGTDEIDLIHNVNERVSLENIGRTLRFYDSLIRS